MQKECSVSVSALALVQADVRQRRQGGDLRAAHVTTGLRLLRKALRVHSLLVSLGLLLDLLVTLHTVQKLLSAFGVLDVLNADMQSLLNNTGVHALVHQDTDGTGGNVPDDTGLAVVVLVRHTLVNTTIAGNVDDLSDVVVLEVGLRGEGAMLAELLLEQVTRVCAVTVRVRHRSCTLD